jgi:hypothetical protein
LRINVTEGNPFGFDIECELGVEKVTFGGQCCLLLQGNGITFKKTLIFFDLDIPLYDGMTAMLILTVNSTKYWCSLKEHISTHMARNMVL